MSAMEALEITDNDTNIVAEQFLTFKLANEEYGLEILSVQCIQGWDKVTPIPNTPSYILGVINLRGAIVPIMDLRQRFNLEPIEVGPATVVIVVKVEYEGNERTVGVVVDAVSEVYRMNAKDIQPSPDYGASGQTEFITGLAHVDGKMIILLDINKLVGSEFVSEVIQ